LLAQNIHRIARIIPCCANHPVRIVLWVCANRTLRESSVNQSNMCAPVGSRQPQSTDVSLLVQTALTRACGLLYAHFLASFLRFRCLNVTTLFNIDVKKICFCAVAANCSAAILRLCCGQSICMQHVFQVFQSEFSHVTVQFRHTTTELWNFDAKQSTLCCFNGFRTLYCCVNADISFCNYYHLNLSRLFSKASVTVTLLRFS